MSNFLLYIILGIIIIVLPIVILVSIIAGTMGSINEEEESEDQ